MLWLQDRNSAYDFSRFLRETHRDAGLDPGGVKENATRVENAGVSGKSIDLNTSNVIFFLPIVRLMLQFSPTPLSFSGLSQRLEIFATLVTLTPSPQHHSFLSTSVISWILSLLQLQLHASFGRHNDATNGRSGVWGRLGMID